jgi:arsenate reductase-like glutaredoxin family protein
MTTDYVSYFKHYIYLTKEFRFEDTLEKSVTYTLDVFNTLSEQKASYSYEKDKWTIKQVISHVIDTERIMSYRALRYARKDKTLLHGFNDNKYAANAGAQERSLDSLISEFKVLRTSTSQLFNSFTKDMLAYDGPEEQKGFTVEKIGRMIAGHSMHHCNILVERYGV